MPKTGVVFRPIIPKPPNVGIVPAKFTKAAKAIARSIEKDLKSPTKSWKHKVIFLQEIKLDYPKSIRIAVTTTDKPYGYQDQGTKAHFIAPKRKKALSWKPKGGVRRFSKGHRVRGVKAKHWTREARKRAESDVKKLTSDLMKQIAKEL